MKPLCPRRRSQWLSRRLAEVATAVHQVLPIVTIPPERRLQLPRSAHRKQPAVFERNVRHLQHLVVRPAQLLVLICHHQPGAAHLCLATSLGNVQPSNNSNNNATLPTPAALHNPARTANPSNHRHSACHPLSSHSTCQPSLCLRRAIASRLPRQPSLPSLRHRTRARMRACHRCPRRR